VKKSRPDWSGGRENRDVKWRTTMPDRRLLATVWLTATVGVALAEWPQWLGPKRDGTATVRIGVWQGGLPVLWRQPVGEGHSGPVVAGGLVYVHARVADREQEEVLALQLKTGQVVWRQAYDRPKFENPFGNGPRATPLVTPDGQLFTLGASGILCCWDARTGKLFWRKDLLAEFSAKNLFFGVSSSPLLVTEQEQKWLVLMVGGADATLVALDPANGQTLWKSGNDPASYSSPVLMEFGGRKLIVALTARHLVAMDVPTGRWLATYPFADKLNETAITPVIIGDRVFISSITAGSVLLRLREQDGQLQWQELWKNPQLNCYFATPVIVGEHLFVVQNQLLPPLARLNCLKLADGQLIWKQPENSRILGKYHGTLLRAEDKVLVLKEDGELLLIEARAENFKELARARVCGNTWAHPALSENLLVVRDEKEIRCLLLPQP
jgi:outer membrane protein assembly factor BamB